MRLFRLIFSTIFHRKAWVICVLAVSALPFFLPLISSATEKPLLIQPARVQAAWGSLWFCCLFWGLFTAAKEGETNTKSGLGEYFQTTGVKAGRQLFEIWLAIFCFIAPLVLITAAICQFAATPHDPAERAMWWLLNLQYSGLFLLVMGPLLALSIALASRFGGITGFAVTIGLTVYGLYGVGYLDNMLKLEANPILHGVWVFSPHYHFADLTQRLYLKSGALRPVDFGNMVIYFTGILIVYAAISRLCFRTKVPS